MKGNEKWERLISCLQIVWIIYCIILSSGLIIHSHQINDLVNDLDDLVNEIEEIDEEFIKLQDSIDKLYDMVMANHELLMDFYNKTN